LYAFFRRNKPLNHVTAEDIRKGVSKHSFAVAIRWMLGNDVIYEDCVPACELAPALRLGVRHGDADTVYVCEICAPYREAYYHIGPNGFSEVRSSTPTTQLNLRIF
jgi:hypothetical protein